MNRTLSAALLTFAALTLLLGGWLVTGWRQLEVEIARAEQTPQREALQRATLLAAELTSRLEALRASEGERPYYEYQNLYHDPRGASEGQSVVPSPLSRGPGDPIIALHFQRLADGSWNVPTVNDELPQLSNSGRQQEDRPLLEAVRDAMRDVSPPRVADATATPPAVHSPSIQVQAVSHLDYAANARPNRVYQELQRHPASPTHVSSGVHEAAAKTAIQIRVTAFHWRTLRLEGSPALAALRTVETPDGTLLQGMLLSRRALSAWLAQRAGSPAAYLDIHFDAQPIGGEANQRPRQVAPVTLGDARWFLEVDPEPQIAQARLDGAMRKRSFLKQLIAPAVLALLCGCLVVILVSRAERLARERSRFAAAAAHELRTPLAGIQLYAEMLEHSLGEPAQRSDYARRITQETARLGRVVTNVLGFTQLEQGALSLQTEAVDVSSVVGEALDRLTATLSAQGIVIERTLPSPTMGSVNSDALVRILENLLDNAEKYTRGRPDRTVLVSVQTLGAYVELSVSDRGPGVPSNARRRLFRPFVRGERDIAGLGLGLALSRAQAEAMGGTLVLRERTGGGSVFTLAVPTATLTHT